MELSETLIEAIDSTSLIVSTDSLDISFGEIASMYDDGEIDIRPAYQRLFRWSITQQSQLIESLILGLPIPPIFVIETESRKYELIDGLQRISSYLHFNGLLKNHEKYEGKKLKLRDCEIVQELNGLTIDDLPGSVRIKIKRSYVKMYIIKRESPPRIKYDMFKRLNTGGSILEAQEIRNSTIRFLGEDFIDFIQELSDNTHFKKTISLIQPYKIERQFDDELVLRFFTLKNANLKAYQQDNERTLADFMTKFAEEVASHEVSFDYEEERKVFNQTFEILSKALGNEIFSNHSNQFYAFYFEAFSIAVAKHIDKITDDKITLVKDKILELKKNKDFQEYTRNDKFKGVSSKNYYQFLHKRIDFATEALNDL